MDSITVSLLYRRLLQHLPQPNNVSQPTTNTTSQRGPFDPTTQFDSSMALTIIVVLTALFFMGFFYVYVRRVTAADQPSPTSASPRPPPNRMGRGLDPSFVKSLPLVAYAKAAKHRMIDDCPVCLSVFQERETVKLIPVCGHVFHSNCIDTWLSAHVTCPLCRSAQLFNNADDREGLSPCEV